MARCCCRPGTRRGCWGGPGRDAGGVQGLQGTTHSEGGEGNSRGVDQHEAEDVVAGVGQPTSPSGTPAPMTNPTSASMSSRLGRSEGRHARPAPAAGPWAAGMSVRRRGRWSRRGRGSRWAGATALETPLRRTGIQLEVSGHNAISGTTVETTGTVIYSEHVTSKNTTSAGEIPDHYGAALPDTPSTTTTGLHARGFG